VDVGEVARAGRVSRSNASERLARLAKRGAGRVERLAARVNGSENRVDACRRARQAACRGPRCFIPNSRPRRSDRRAGARCGEVAGPMPLRPSSPSRRAPPVARIGSVRWRGYSTSVGRWFTNLAAIVAIFRGAISPRLTTARWARTDWPDEEWGGDGNLGFYPHDPAWNGCAFGCGWERTGGKCCRPGS